MKAINKKIAEETARLLFSIKAITLSPKKPYRYTSGILSPIYCDNRLIISYPGIRKKIADLYMEIIEKQLGIENVDFVSGTATAAVPHAALIADRLKKPMVYVESAKGEKGESKIGGKLKQKKRVIIIEDHISTGGSTVKNVLTVRKAGGITNVCIATTTYNMQKAKKAFKQNKIKVYCLTDITSILETAVKTDLMKADEKEIVKKWTQDPVGWGKKMGFE